MCHDSLAALLVLCAALVAPANAETILEKAARDEVIDVPDGDPDMARAMDAARASLPDFLALAKAPPPDAQGFAVKIGVRDGVHVEYFWIQPFEEKDGQVVGLLANEPRYVRSVEYGQIMRFAVSEIVDWTYFEGGKMLGNYTVCAMLKREPAEEAHIYREQMGLDCAF